MDTLPPYIFLVKVKWIYGCGRVLVHDGIEGVHIHAIAGVVCEEYHYIDRGHGVLLYDGGDRILIQ